MKRINRYAYPLAFFALTGLFTFTSCSSSDEPDEPNVNPSETVKTSFSLSVGLPQNKNNAKPTTRVSEAIAQAQTTPTFRGIDNITLIPFYVAGSETSPVTSATTRLGSNITLPGTNNNVFEAGNTNQVYANVNLPQGTSAFLFYGKAIDGTVNNSISSDADRHTYGTLSNNLSDTSNPSDISFSPVQVNNLQTAPAKAQALADYLTSIAKTSITVDGTTVNWSDNNNGSNPLYNEYQQFIKINAGSSNSVRIALQTLYNSINEGEMANAIKASITAKATVDTNGNLTLNSDLAGYPDATNDRIPDGVCVLNWDDANKQFNVSVDGTINGNVTNTKPSDLVYPANLQYYANTGIKTSNQDQSTNYPSSTTWTDITAKYTDGTQVTPSTRAVALTNQIQYAVGRMDITVKEGADQLKDHNGDNVAGSTTSGSSTTSSFPISAIFVGGQRPVGFNFEPQTNSTQYTIYDNVVPTNWSAALSGTDATIAHTLALETPADEVVRVAVELTNNSGSDFHGHDDQIIYKGAKFYLVAELNPATTGTVTQPTGTTTLNQVIKQDYITKANLTIDAAGGEKGLGGAYNVLPDLRNPKLSLGMSVDLQWQSGLTFNVNM